MTSTAQSTDTSATPSPGTSLANRTPARSRSAPTHAGHHQRAARKAVEANTTQLDFHIGQTQVHVVMPPLDKLAFYAGLAGAAAFGAVEWPIALLTGVGHLLSDDRRNRTLRALGEALDAAI
jgi:hypothetical protein